ncbi:hypothetical protein HOY34_04510 [Xinfangfangia sp. D13-10-4-6]|uniref:phage tail assembly chaperone n=1 Tax=Pseudogemmobacter hezensis TaxID=2737662 RepID=UPI001552E92E|nr:hypothetical protein [Pseudogemmobacter hezensis]NPD14461.1 hypothetical protein [Pseudogemmobacter hezensis]
MRRLSRQLSAAVTAALKGENVRPPEAGRLLWNTFQRLSLTRTYHPAGPNALQPSEVEAYCRMMRLALEPRHISILMEMDRAWLDQAYAKNQRAPEGMKTLPQRSSQPLTAALADLVLG